MYLALFLQEVIMEEKTHEKREEIIFAPTYTGKDRRNNKDRRSGKPRRKKSNPNYDGPEHRSGKERRSGKDRRKSKANGYLF